MGNSYYCCNPPQPDKRFEIRNPPQNSKSQKKNQQRQDDEKNSTTINPSNNMSVKKDEQPENEGKAKQHNEHQYELYDNYDEEQFDPIIMQKVIDIQKQTSVYKTHQKQKYILFSKLFQKQINQKNNILIKGDPKIIKQEIFNNMFKREFVINQKEQKDAKERLENFLYSSQEEFYNLEKFSVWFDEDWYEDYDEIMRTIKDLVVNLPSTLSEIVLNFWGMKIGIEGTRQLVRGLKKQKILTILDINLDTGDVGNIGVTQMGQVIGTQLNLTQLKLNLSSNDIDLLGFERLCQGLVNLKNLQSFDFILSENKIGHEGGIVLSQCLEQFNQLQILNLNLQNNKIGDNSACQIIEKICKLPKLSQVYIGLSDNQITDQGLIRIMQDFGKCKSNKFNKLILGLAQNQISNNQAMQLENMLKNHYNQDATIYVFY